MIKKKNHPVELAIDKNGYVVAHPSNLDHMKIGDRFQVKSKEGHVRVVFDNWPFDGKKHAITDSRIRTFTTKGPFTFSCRIVKGQNPTTGSPAYRKGAGAHGNVDPPGRP
jgi:hypothetical protein